MTGESGRDWEQHVLESETTAELSRIRVVMINLEGQIGPEVVGASGQSRRKPRRRAWDRETCLGIKG